VTRAKRQHVLTLLVESIDGVTEAALAAHRVTLAEISELAAEGLVTATAQRIGAGAREIVVTRVRITDAGRVRL